MHGRHREHTQHTKVHDAPDFSSLSSNVARSVPGAPGAAFFICPRMPLTVRTVAPSNLATSISELNIPSMKAVCLKIFTGWPTSLSFFFTGNVASASRTTPVAATRKPVVSDPSVLKAAKAVLGGTRGPYTTAWQCMCSGVYLHHATSISTQWQVVAASSRRT